MSDTRVFDLRELPLELALQVAMFDEYLRPGDDPRKIEVYGIDHVRNRFVVFWTMPNSWPSDTLTVSHFVAPLTRVQLQTQIEAWLDAVDYPPAPNIDGSAKKSCRVWTGPRWRFVEEYGHASSFAVEPVWALYGK